MGTITALTAGVCFVTGGTAAALVCVLVGAIGCYVVVSASLWVDAENAGSTCVFMWGSCRRDDLDHMLVSARHRCLFVRKDGRVAFSAPGLMFGNVKLEALAEQLGVPLYGRVVTL